MTFIVPLIIILAIAGYFYYIKKSGKLGVFQQNHIEAAEDVAQNFQIHFENLKKDPETFKPIAHIIGTEFESIIACKKPKSIAGAITETAKTMLTGVALKDNLTHTLVLTNTTLHYLSYSTHTKKAIEHWEFQKDNIENLVLEDGKITDNLKQSMSFDLQGGGKSGDAVDNSSMKKLQFTSKNKKYEFFLYDIINFGKGFVQKQRAGGLAMNQSKEDIIKDLLKVKVAENFLENIIKI